MTDLVDWSFIITLAVIILATLIGAYLRSAHKDRCLRDFDGYHITVERKNNRVIWGDMHLQATGFEMIYRSDVQDDDHMETSYVLYKDEYDEIQAIYRYARDLTEELQKQRARSVAKSLHPGIFRRSTRGLRNFLSTASDSFSEALTLTLGRVRRRGAALMNDTSQTYIRGIGKDVIGYVGTSYDALLEKFVGTRVVVEVVEDNEVHEHVGMLKEYSADFLEVLDVYYPLPREVRLNGQDNHQIADRIAITFEEGHLRVHNMNDQPQYLERVIVAGQEMPLNAIVAGGEEVAIKIEGDNPPIMLHMRVALRLDMIVPRAHAMIRHRAERYDPATIFDVGLSLVRRDHDEREILRLRQALRYAPQDAISAAKLGELLMQQSEFIEAEHWLLEAKERAHRLPDQGNRVAQNLRRVQRQLEQMRLQDRLAEELRIISVGNADSMDAAEESFEI